MAKFIALLTLFALTIPNPAQARFESMSDQSYRKWLSKDVGKFAYQDSIKDFVEASPFIESKDKLEFITLMEAASVSTQKYMEVLNRSDLPEVEKQRLQALTRNRGFLFLYYLEQEKVPAEMLSLFDLKKTYEVGKIVDGEICQGMPFTVGGVHKMRNVVFSGPATSALVFKTKGGRIVNIVLKCNNGCISSLGLIKVHIPSGMPTVTEQLEKELSPPPKVKKALASVAGEVDCPDGRKLIANVWSFCLGTRAIGLLGACRARSQRFSFLTHLSKRGVSEIGTITACVKLI